MRWKPRRNRARTSNVGNLLLDFGGVPWRFLVLTALPMPSSEPQAFGLETARGFDDFYNTKPALSCYRRFIDGTIEHHVVRGWKQSNHTYVCMYMHDLTFSGLMVSLLIGMFFGFSPARIPSSSEGSTIKSARPPLCECGESQNMQPISQKP